jgi:hypothetical protein
MLNDACPCVPRQTSKRSKISRSAAVDMAPNAPEVHANGNGNHANGSAAVINGDGRPAMAPQSAHQNRWNGVERPYSQVSLHLVIIKLMLR